MVVPVFPVDGCDCASGELRAHLGDERPEDCVDTLTGDTLSETERKFSTILLMPPRGGASGFENRRQFGGRELPMGGAGR